MTGGDSVSLSASIVAGKGVCLILRGNRSEGGRNNESSCGKCDGSDDRGNAHGDDACGRGSAWRS